MKSPLEKVPSDLSEASETKKSHQSKTPQVFKHDTENQSSVTLPTFESMYSQIPDEPKELALPSRAEQNPPSFSRRASVSVLDNTTASFSSSTHPMEILTPHKTSESEIDNSTSDYLASLGITITKTWLLIYSTIIRILNLLVSISLSYEKHALSFLRALSIIALVICCKHLLRV